MKRNKKLTILALSVMLVMTLAVTVISFSFADDNDNNPNAGIQLTADTSTGATLTNIDYIIKGTAAADAEPYKIVEIGSVPVATEDGEDEPYTTFGEFAEKNEGFRNYVINGNRTITEEMAEQKINYVYYYSADVTDDNEDALADISSADFIYVSNDASKPYSTDNGNDINEELYNILHIYAVGDYKPFVIDSPADSGSSDIGGGGVTATTTFDDLVKAYYAKSGYLYNTFQWDNNVDDMTFYDGSRSLYIAISGRARMSYWTTVTTAADADTSAEMAEILVVSKDGTSVVAEDVDVNYSNNTFFKTALFNATYVASLYDKNAGAEITPEANQYFFNIENTSLFASGYSKRYETYKPEYARVTELSFATLQADATFDYTKYDLVIFEDDLAGASLTDEEFYKRLVGAMYGKTHIIFSDVYGSTSTDTDSDDNKLTTSNDSNYNELYFMVATEDGIERFANIMITTKTELDIIMSSNNAGTCKVIADLINSSSFRGIGGPSSTSNMFTVLEIQPCYPIDTTLASKLGNSALYNQTKVTGEYYTSPADMVNGKTREQLGIETDVNGNSIVTADTPQYYDWELSEAKIAELTGMDVSQVKVVHMSTEELATSKVEILGNYDLVYIGGNTSALLDATSYWSVSAYQNAFYSSNGGSLAALNAAPVYAMYSHNGDIVNISLSSSGEGGVIRSSNSFADADYDYATSSTSFSTYNGNDITRSDLESLCDYVDAGMPLVVNKDLYNAYYLMNQLDNRYLQNSIDPDSNICQFLDYCNQQTTDGAKNILWNFDHESTEQVDNDGGRLGDTAIGTVEVFEGEGTDNVVDREDLENLLNTSTKKPKVAVTSMPATYNMYDKSTRLQTTSLKFEYDVANVPSDYKVYLYIDYNKDGSFIEDEIVAESTGDTLTCDLASVDNFGEDYFGPVYWQLEVEAKYGDKTSSAFTSGICYVDGESTKQELNVLQIIPDDTSYGDSTGMQGTTTLLFCTECQRALKVLYYNPVSDSTLDNYYNVYDGHITDVAGQWTSYIDANGYANIFKTGLVNGQGTETPIYMGRHDHDFGIVKYDSTKTMDGSTNVGMDDWDDNLADELADLYDFDIDILTSREYEDMNKQVQTDVNNMIASLVADGKIKNTTVATLTDDEKETLKQAFMEEAAVYDEAYNTAVEAVEKAEQDLQDTLDIMIANSTARAGYDYKEQFESIKVSERYGDFYMIWGTSWNGTYPWNGLETIFSDGVSYTDLYNAWTTATDDMLEAEENYERYFRAANYENWLLASYGCVIIGPAEDFNGDDIYDEDINAGYGALDMLEKYIEGDGTIILFHDTLTKFADVGSVNLTTRLRAAFGQDKNHMNELDNKIIEASGNSSSLYYLPYNVDEGYSEDTYFMTNLSSKPTDDDTRYLTWLDDIKAASGNNWMAITGNKYLTTTAFTDGYLLSTSSYGNTPSMYKYAEYSWGVAATWNKSAAATASAGANRSTQVNKGLVTMYPYTLSDRLNISPTHVQAYALDLEPSNMTVWYTLAGGTYGNNGASSLHAASPNDGTDSYFIYSFGNVFYCGAGHAEITGALKDNNDERRLYLNVICNAATNVPITSISAYDYGATADSATNNVVKKNGKEYIYKLDETDTVPEFSFKFTLGKGLSLRQVNLYYDIDESGTYTEGDVYIKQYTSSQIKSGDYTNVPTSLEALDEFKLTIDPTYLTNGKYVYIVIEVVDTDGKKTRKKIRVEYKDTLYNLT